MSSENQDLKETVLFENNRCKILYDIEYKVRVDINSNQDAELIAPVNKLVMDLNNMPIDKRNRLRYGNDIKNIYQMALNNQLDNALEYGYELKKVMERNLMLIRKAQYVIPPMIFYLIMIIFSYCMRRHFENNIFNVIIFSFLGGLLSLILQQRNLEVDYKVDNYIIIIEGLKRVIITMVIGSIGYVAIRANILFSNINIFENEYYIFLILIACGYSSTFIPNLLDSILKNQNNEKDRN